MAVTEKTIIAAAACSWIDPATGLPETDSPLRAASVQRSFLTGNHGFRFCLSGGLAGGGRHGPWLVEAGQDHAGHCARERHLCRTVLFENSVP